MDRARSRFVIWILFNVNQFANVNLRLLRQLLQSETLLAPQKLNQRTKDAHRCLRGSTRSSVGLRLGLLAKGSIRTELIERGIWIAQPLRQFDLSCIEGRFRPFDVFFCLWDYPSQVTHGVVNHSLDLASGVVILVAPWIHDSAYCLGVRPA